MMQSQQSQMEQFQAQQLQAQQLQAQQLQAQQLQAQQLQAQQLQAQQLQAQQLQAQQLQAQQLQAQQLQAQQLQAQQLQAPQLQTQKLQKPEPQNPERLAAEDQSALSDLTEKCALHYDKTVELEKRVSDLEEILGAMVRNGLDSRGSIAGERGVGAENTQPLSEAPGTGADVSALSTEAVKTDDIEIKADTTKDEAPVVEDHIESPKAEVEVEVPKAEENNVEMSTIQSPSEADTKAPEMTMDPFTGNGTTSGTMRIGDIGIIADGERNRKGDAIGLQIVEGTRSTPVANSFSVEHDTLAP